MQYGDRCAAAGARTGAVLLEVIVALTILALAGISAVSLASESARAMARAHEADESIARASAFFDAVALWTRDDLDRRLGEHAQGPWHLRVARPVPMLYVLSLSDSVRHAVVLETALFRPEVPSAQK